MGEVQRPALTRRAVSVGRRRYPRPRRVGRRGNDVLTAGGGGGEGEFTCALHVSLMATQATGIR